MTPRPHDVIGFIAPTLTYDKMRATQEYARAFDDKVTQYVQDAAFKAAWKSWYANAWTPFYDKFAGPNSSWSSKFGVFVTGDTDELASRAEGYRRQMVSFRDDYGKMRGSNGQPLPLPAGEPPPNVQPTASQTSFWASIPWWGWAIGGTVVLGLGYYVYRQATGAIHVARALGGR